MIGRRSSLASGLIVLAAALALPATTIAASPFQAIVRRDVCTDSGGAHGRGYVLLKVKAREVGVSGVNYFVIKSKLQWNSGISWGLRSNYPTETSSNFANDGVNHYRVVERRYDFKPSDAVLHRIVIKVQFWSNSSGLLTTRTVYGSAC